MNKSTPLSRQNTLPLFAQGGAINLLLCAKIAVAMPLLVWMAVSISDVAWKLLPVPEVESEPVAFSNRAFEPQRNTDSRPNVDITALKSIALFGKEAPKVVQQPKPTPPPVLEKVEETKLNLSLVGSFANNVDEKKAYAIIANGRNQSLYKVDEEINDLNDVSLLKVLSDRVIINNRGKQEALLMYPEGESLSSSSVATSSSSDSNLSRLERNASSNAVQQLAGLSEQEKLRRISDVIRFTRRTQNGKMIGFRVLPGRNREVFEQTGLQLNDVVTAIDGQTLDNLRSANKIYKEKRNATQASLTVLRDDQELSIDIDLNNINLN